MYERILTVCTGNICRSPLAEAMLRLQLADEGRAGHAQVRSAGLGAVLGRRADDTVLYLAKTSPALLALLEQHRSQPLTLTLTWWADLILVMEPRHARRVAELDPAATAKVRLLGQWTGQTIGDPYLKHESVYRDAHSRIEGAVASWRETINR